jgi:hypothetical protein
MKNPLIDVLPALWRRRLYALLAVASVVAAPLVADGVDLGPVPAILVGLTALFGATAASNTSAE